MLKYELSHWEWDAFLRDIDIAVLGSGIVGLTAAICLKEKAPKLRVVVIDRGVLPIGASTRNAGFACFGSLSELEDDLEQSTREEVVALVQRRYQGLRLLRQRLGDEAVVYEPFGGYEVFRRDDQTHYEQCMASLAQWNKDLERVIGVKDVYRTADEQLETIGLQGIEHLIVNRAEGQIHTGHMMQALLKLAEKLGIRMLNGLNIVDIAETGQGVELQTAEGWTIKTGQALVCTNGFAKQLLPSIAVAPARNQVLITEPIPKLRLKGSFHYDRGYVYFRNVGNRVLLGGGRQLDPVGEQTMELGQTTQIQDYLLNLLQTVILPDQPVAIDRWWSGIMGVGNQKVPVVKAVSDHLAVAVRLGGMGVALGSLVGEQAANLLLGRS